MSKSELLKHALELPEVEREKLAIDLLDSLEEVNRDEEREKAFAQELERRITEVESGKVACQDWHEALAEMRDALHRRRKS